MPIPGHLYSLLIRAILNEECKSSSDPASDHSSKGKKAKAWGGGKLAAKRGSAGGVELAEKLRQIVGGIGREEHLRVVGQQENWIAFLLVVSVEFDGGGQGDTTGFILQIASGDQREEHFLLPNDRPLEIILPYGRRSLLRLFPMDRPNHQHHFVGNSHFYRRSASPPPLHPPPSSHHHLHPSSTTSSSSIPSVVSNEAAGHGHHFGLNSLAAKSSSLLRRWTNRSRCRRRSPLLTVRVRDLPPNRQHQLAIPGVSTRLKFTLIKSPTNPDNGQFKPMAHSEFVTILRELRDVFLRKWTDYEAPPEQVEEEDGGKDDDGDGGQLADLAKAFRHFNAITETSEAMRETLEEVIRRMGRFNDFSPLAQSLLVIGVNLEECRFGEVGEPMERADEKRVELARATIFGELGELREGDHQIEQEQEMKAAIFLSERLAEALTAVAKLAKVRRLFLPPLQCHSSPLGPFLATHSARFNHFADQISPLLDLLQSPIWDHPGVSGLVSSISRLFDQCLQQQFAEFIRIDIAQAQGDGLDAFGDLVDSLRLFLTHSAAQSVERVLERLWLPYFARLLQTFDDPLCQAGQSLLKAAIGMLNPRDDHQTVEFTKLTMRLFDAFGQLAELSKQFGDHCSLQEFEPGFEAAAIYWTGTWRSLYIGLVRKCVLDSNPVTNPNGTPATPDPPPAPPPPSPLSHRRSSLFDPFCSSSPSPPRGSRQFVLADFRRPDIQLHEATVNCLALCKALCDDFLRLKARHPAILLLGILQICSILADCLSTFCSLLLEQVKARPTFTQMLRAANGIEHASAYLLQNFERFLEIQRLAELDQMDETERGQALASCRRIIGAARTRSRAVADQIVESLCQRKLARMRHYCAQVTRNWSQLRGNDNKKPLRSYLRQMFSPANEHADQLLVFLDKACAHLHASLLPRLYSTARLALWQTVRRILEQQLLKGESPEYYEQVENASESICQILQLDWTEERSVLLRLVHSNKASTKELILQYYAHLAEMGATNGGWQRPVEGGSSGATMPRLCVRLGYVRTTSQQFLLQIHVLSAFNIPILDTLTHSSDPYLRIELLPRFLFPLDDFPVQNTETKKQTLNPRWNQVFQMALPDELFFMNGACLCLTVLDHDVMSYNDLAGQAFLPLATIPRLNDLSTRKMPPPLVIPLRMPHHGQYAIEPFQILEQRSGRGDLLAKEATAYEKYIRDYHILPPCAQDEKEWTLRMRRAMRQGRERVQRMMMMGGGGSGGRGGSWRW